MLSWGSIAGNALWIFGLSLALAVLSLAYWQSRMLGKRMSLVLSRSGWGLALNLAGFIFCLGLGILSAPVWGKVLWFFLVGLLLYNTAVLIAYRKN